MPESSSNQASLPAAGNSSKGGTAEAISPPLWPAELPGGALKGVCLSARSAARHQGCSAEPGVDCGVGEACMQPVLAKDEHLFKVCACQQHVFDMLSSHCTCPLLSSRRCSSVTALGPLVL